MKKIVTEGSSYQLVSLFMRGFLRPDRLAQAKEVERWTSAIERVKASNWGKWAGFTRQVIVEVAEPALTSTLERPLSESERLFMWALADEFVEQFARERLEKMY